MSGRKEIIQNIIYSENILRVKGYLYKAEIDKIESKKAMQKNL